MCWRTPTGPAPATDPQKPSTAGWSTCADQPWASGTWPTTSPPASSKPADSDHKCALVCDEPNKAETLTILPIVQQFQARHGIADMVVVADAGMLSAETC